MEFFFKYQTLYTYPENFRAYKALIAAEFSGVQVNVASDFEFGVTNKTEAFLKKFPTGQVSINRHRIRKSLPKFNIHQINSQSNRIVHRSIENGDDVSHTYQYVCFHMFKRDRFELNRWRYLQKGKKADFFHCSLLNSRSSWLLATSDFVVYGDRVKSSSFCLFVPQNSIGI